jgi:hypothetical protein
MKVEPGYRYLSGILVSFFMLVVVAGSAVSISIQPETIAQGDQVTIGIQGLANDSSFSLQLEGSFVPENDHFMFRTTQFMMPLTLNEGQISAYAENTTSAGISVKKETTTLTMSGVSTNGIFQATEARNVSEGIYDFLQIEGDRTPGATRVLTRLSLTGVKEGPDTSHLSFIIDGIAQGTVQVQITVDGSVVLNKILTVVSPSSPGYDLDSGTTVIPVSTPPVQTTPSSRGRTILSADGMVRIDTDAAVAIHPLDDGIVVQGWKLLSSPYAVTPADYPFDPPAILSFILPAGITTPAFLAQEENGEWRMLPSRIEGGTISAEIYRTGIYGLMTMDENSVGGTTETPVAMTPAEAGTTPSLAPPLELLGIILALGCGAIVRRKR